MGRMDGSRGRAGQGTAVLRTRGAGPLAGLGVALVIALAGGGAQAQVATPASAATAPQNQLSLATSAVVELPRDLMTVALSTTREGADPAAVQSAVRQALDAALAEARRAARPGQVDVQTGHFSLQPRYSPKGGITGWVGSAELVIEGHDMTAISQLVGRIQTLTVARVGYGLSREARERVESEATALAVERFRTRAGELARLFGFTGYAIGEVNVSSADASPPMPVFRQARAMAAGAPADESLPVEAGKGSVTITVNGSVRLTR